MHVPFPLSCLLVLVTEDFFGLASWVVGFTAGKRADNAGDWVGGEALSSESLRKKGEECFLLRGR